MTQCYLTLIDFCKRLSFFRALALFTCCWMILMVIITYLFMALCDHSNPHWYPKIGDISSKSPKKILVRNISQLLMNVSSFLMGSIVYFRYKQYELVRAFDYSYIFNRMALFFGILMAISAMLSVNIKLGIWFLGYLISIHTFFISALLYLILNTVLTGYDVVYSFKKKVLFIFRMFLTIVYLLALIFYVLCTIFWGEDFNWDVDPGQDYSAHKDYLYYQISAVCPWLMIIIIAIYLGSTFFDFGNLDMNFYL